MHKIGSYVYIAKFCPIASVTVDCPDCGGTGRIRMITHDDITHSIECGCGHGYDKPSGKITIHQSVVEADHRMITEVCQTKDGFEYVLGCTIVKDCSVFLNEADALAHGEKQRKEYIAEQERKIFSKEKDTRTWAWNVRYHRSEIKRLEKNIAYHTAKLNAANLKVKP